MKDLILSQGFPHEMADLFHELAQSLEEHNVSADSDQNGGHFLGESRVKGYSSLNSHISFLT